MTTEYRIVEAGNREVVRVAVVQLELPAHNAGLNLI